MISSNLGCDRYPAISPEWRSFREAGHLAGAFRRIGRADIADEIMTTMKAADYDVRERDPFEERHVFGVLDTGTSPIVGRLQAMWEAMRGGVIAAFPKAPDSLPTDKRISIPWTISIKAMPTTPCPSKATTSRWN